MQFKEILEDVNLWIAVLWVLLVAGVIWGAVKSLPVFRKLAAFLSDVAGEDARPGRPRVPGLFERLATMETQQAEMQTTQQEVLQKVNVVHHEVFPNSGKSLRDQTNRIEEKVSKDYKEISELKKTVTTLESTVSEHITASTAIIKTITEEKNS